MKKVMVICLCFAALLVAGCDIKHDVTVKNNSGGTVRVNMSSSSSTPSSYYSIGDGEKHTFTDIGAGTQYIFVVYNSVGQGKRFDVNISYDATYYVEWRNSEIVLRY